MIRDLVEVSIDMIREEKLELVADRAEINAEERMLELLMPPQQPQEGVEAEDTTEKTREKLRASLREGKLDDRMVEIEVRERNMPVEIVTNAGIEEMDINLRDMLPGLFGGKSRRRIQHPPDRHGAIQAGELDQAKVAGQNGAAGRQPREPPQPARR